MKTTCAMLGALTAAFAAHATVTVSDVTFTQDAATHDVTVSYDLTTSDGEPAFVSLDVLTNGVSVGATRVKNFSGDVSTSPADTASLVSPGTGKRITWKARADLPNVGLTDASVRVSAIATNHFEGLYMVVDLSRGRTSSYYPVQYTACKPDTNSPAFYTTELWLRRVPAGTFAMGYGTSGDAAPVHNVTLTKDFYCGVVLVTRGQHALIQGTPNGADPDGTYARYPVSNISYDALRGSGWPEDTDVEESNSAPTIGRLRYRTGLMFDLPTEAQWEYACRAGHSGSELNDGTAYEGTDKNIRPGVGYYDLGWGQANSGYSKASPDNHWHPVALKKPSDWDFYDFYGNVLEWCRDWYGTYSSDDQTDPPGAGSESGTLRVSRGGNYRLNASTLNSFFRRHVDNNNNGGNQPATAYIATGYRLVVETDEGDSAATAQGVQRGSNDSPVGLLETRPAATLDGRRFGSEALADSYIDTATPLAFVLIVR